jgi:hypothetical protein
MHTRRTVQEYQRHHFERSLQKVQVRAEFSAVVKFIHQSSQLSILNSSASSKANALVTEIPHSKPML